MNIIYTYTVVYNIPRGTSKGRRKRSAPLGMPGESLATR